VSQEERNYLVYVDSSSIHGEGLFAACELTAGQLIGNYQGPVVEQDGMYVLWIEQEEDVWVGYDGRNCMRYLNHADSPNAEMDGLQCYALEDISINQEITIDYGWNEA
jgi:SET domain-containing protein